jgi:hypothetical protein
MLAERAGPVILGAPVQSFDTEIMSLVGVAIPDPDFALLTLTAGAYESPGLDSPGHTTLTLQGNEWVVDSFFDVNYEIAFVGAPGGALAGMSGTTRGTVTMGAVDDASGGGVSCSDPQPGEGSILSVNADCSTSNTTFSDDDTLNMSIWSESVDSANMKKAEWELKDASTNKVKQNFTNHANGTFSAAYNLSDLPSNQETWTWKGRIEDNYKNKHEIRKSISVIANGGSGASCANAHSGEGYFLSASADCSTSDTSFSDNDTLNMSIWNESVDGANMKKAEWELKDASTNKVKQNFTNHGNGTFSATFDLDNLPSNAVNWTWKGKIEDNQKKKYRGSRKITVK